MPKYDYDQCVQCGGVRVVGSTLCASCLAEIHKKLLTRCAGLELKIKQLEGKNKKLTALCERLLDHITSEAVYAGELERLMTGARKIAKKEMS